ncbi:MAG: ABC transporter substrate-binding protein [Acutalibacteraceae bacterium]
MKKIIIAIVALTVVICGAIVFLQLNPPVDTSISSQPTTLAMETSPRTISLPYYKNKAFNPYTTNSPTNLKISTLLYDSLFIINDDWSAKKLLVSDFENDGKQVTVKIIDDAVFSNGASLSAYDVVYSFELAKKSVFFKGRLSNFVSAAAESNKVIFTLKTPDAYVQNCLTFPIVQNSTGKAAVPIGSGRYILINNEGSYVLTANEKSTRGETLLTKQLTLSPINSEENQVYLIQTGELSYYYDDMSLGKVVNINANTVSVSTNSLIYLGLNSNNSFFSDEDVKNAICYAIDKSTIADTVFDNICDTCYVPFNPNWYVLQGITLPDYEHNIIKAGELLSYCGYNFSGTAEKYRLSSDGGYLNLTLVVNKENSGRVTLANLIAKQLGAVGIGVTTQALSYSEYVSALNSGDFDLYVGEVKLSPNMDLSAFFTTGGAASYGISSSSTTAKAYNDFKTGSIDAPTFIEVFDGNKPFIPICFRGGTTYYAKDITFEGTGNEYEPFGHIYSWSNDNE